MALELVGQTLAGRYEILSPLGEESVGSVWAGRDRETGARVQVKVVHDLGGAGDETRFARFAREMKASFLVTHKNTVEVVDFGEETAPDRPRLQYLVLEWLVAHPVDRELAAGPLPWERAVRIAAQVAVALGAAHQEGIVHRALAPSRILLLENCEGVYVKVADFGLAKLEGEGAESQVTTAGTRLGDLHYAAPEYVENGTFTAKSDLYALGAVLFHLVAGRPPFEGEMTDLFEQHLKVPAPRLRQVRPDAPAWVDELVAELLSKNPAERPGVYKIVARIEEALDAPLDTPALWPLDAEGRPIRPPPPADTPSADGSYRALGIVLMGAIGGVGLLTVVVGLLAVVWVLLR